MAVEDLLRPPGRLKELHTTLVRLVDWWRQSGNRPGFSPTPRGGLNFAVRPWFSAVLLKRSISPEIPVPVPGILMVLGQRS